MAAFGDKYDEQRVIVNNILTKAITLSKYCDLSKIENSLYLTPHETYFNKDNYPDFQSQFIEFKSKLSNFSINSSIDSFI